MSGTFLRGSGRKNCLLLPLMHFPSVWKNSGEYEEVQIQNTSTEVHIWRWQLVTPGKFGQPVRKSIARQETKENQLSWRELLGSTVYSTLFKETAAHRCCPISFDRLKGWSLPAQLKGRAACSLNTVLCFGFFFFSPFQSKNLKWKINWLISTLSRRI